MNKLHFHPSAHADLSAIRDYIAQDSKAAARQVVEAIFRAIAQLGVFARSGRRGRAQGTYELVLRHLPYIVVYRLLDDRVEVIAIVHMARSWLQKTIE